MPPRLDFEFLYRDEPILLVSVGDLLNSARVFALGLIDTGAQISLFEHSIAARLGIDLTNAPSVRIRSIEGTLSVARRAEVDIRLLDEPDLAVRLSIAFAQRQYLGLRNLIGLDVLEFFDFGLSHSARLGYIGRAEV